MRPPWGIASRAFTTRFISTCSIWPGSASTYQSAGSQLDLERDVGADEPAQHALGLRHHVIEREDLRLEHLSPAEGEQLAGEARGPLAGVADLLDVAADRVALPHLLQQQIAVAEDRR